MLDRDRRTTGAAGAAGTLSAMAVGGFGWLAAHTLNFWLVAHSHHGALSSTARHVHEATAAATVVAGALAAASLIAAVVAGGHRSATRRTTVPAAVGLSSVAFLAADALEHAILGLDSTPPQAVILGLVLHGSFGAVSSLYWARFTDCVRSLVIPPTLSLADPPTRPAQRDRQAPRPRRLIWACAVAGRAPPVR